MDIHQENFFFAFFGRSLISKKRIGSSKQAQKTCSWLTYCVEHQPFFLFLLSFSFSSFFFFSSSSNFLRIFSLIFFHSSSFLFEEDEEEFILPAFHFWSTANFYARIRHENFFFRLIKSWRGRRETSIEMQLYLRNSGGFYDYIDCYNDFRYAFSSKADRSTFLHPFSVLIHHRFLANDFELDAKDFIGRNRVEERNWFCQRCNHQRKMLDASDEFFVAMTRTRKLQAPTNDRISKVSCISTKNGNGNKNRHTERYCIKGVCDVK